MGRLIFKFTLWNANHIAESFIEYHRVGIGILSASAELNLLVKMLDCDIFEYEASVRSVTVYWFFFCAIYFARVGHIVQAQRGWEGFLELAYHQCSHQCTPPLYISAPCLYL